MGEQGLPKTGESSDESHFAEIEGAMRQRLEAALPAFRRGAYCYIGCCVVIALAHLAETGLLLRILWLVDSLGFSQLTLDLLERVTAYERLIGLALLFSGLLSAVLFLRLLYTAQRAGNDFYLGPWSWKFRWNVICLFLPIVNLYVPWAGFAQIHERWTHYAARRRRSWESLGFPWATFLVALLYLLYALVSGFAERQLERFDEPATVEAWFSMTYNVLALQALVTIVFAIAAFASSHYLLGLYRGMLSVARSQPASREIAADASEQVEPVSA